jgi:hypothetical protein
MTPSLINNFIFAMKGIQDVHMASIRTSLVFCCRIYHLLGLADKLSDIGFSHSTAFLWPQAVQRFVHNEKHAEWLYRLCRHFRRFIKSS